eukprot:981561-Pelagomonas_calceolata.AAC.1
MADEWSRAPFSRHLQQFAPHSSPHLQQQPPQHLPKGLQGAIKRAWLMCSIHNISLFGVRGGCVVAKIISCSLDAQQDKHPTTVIAVVGMP